ncbi:MAG: hypothetical protein WC683_02465 [bacterium]
MSASRNFSTEPSRRTVVLDLPEIYERAKQMRKVFQGEKPKKRVEMPFTWPSYFVYVGRALSELYFSDKKLNGGKWEIYKHVAEAGQDLYVNPKITTLIKDDGRKMQYRGDRFCLEGAMPKDIAVLAENRGVQVVTKSGEYYEIRMPHSTTAAAVHPETGETFLLVYSKEGVHFIITGDELTIGKDGIAG